MESPASCDAVVKSGTTVHRVEQSFLAHAITIWNINLDYEEVYVAKSYGVCGQVLMCAPLPTSFIFT